MNVKTVFAAAVLTLGVSTSAFADVIDAGTLPIAPAAPWTKIVTHDGAGVSFTDTLNFSIAASQLTSAANSLSLSLGSDTTSTISGLSYTLWDATGHEIGGTYTGNNTTYANLLSSPGSYHFEISGTVVGTTGGYAVSLLTSAVPEPETYGLMLGGLALVGAIARRKSAKKSV